MIRVGIIGASGYTGAELARIVSNHPEMEITVATSRQYEGRPLADVFPHLQDRVTVTCENPEDETIITRADVYFTAVPHKTAMDIVPRLLGAGRKVVDLSADFRLQDADIYEKWYQPHTAKEYLAEAIYGLPELHREDIKRARLVANPGCYPTSILLGISPLLKAGMVMPESLIFDSKSGTSGAGRGAQTGTLYCEVTDGFRAYKVGDHRHTPEIEQEVNRQLNSPVTVSFTPHLVPMSRGIFSTIYAQATREVTDAEIREIFTSFYREEYFVRLCGEGKLPASQYVRGSNFCDIGWKYDTRTKRIIILSVIDNLVKGAAGQAVQNMNLICGLPEKTGLEQLPLFP